MAATGTLDGLSYVVIAYEKSLYFAQFQRVQYAAQSGNATAVAAGLAQGFTNRFLGAGLLRVGENAFGIGVNFFAAHVSQVGGKPAQQALRNVGMQLWFELRPKIFLTAQNPFFECAFFQSFFEKFGDELEVLAGFIGDAALGVASVVSCEAVAAAATGERMK